jgi:two-component system chemotaxis response regulator CheB
MRLMDGPPIRFVKPSVDVLLESAALSFEKRLVSVILSGAGTDGAAGTKAVFEHGGCTIAQHPDTCQFNGMPDTAIATGMVQQIVPIGLIAHELERMVHDGRPHPDDKTT